MFTDESPEAPSDDVMAETYDEHRRERGVFLAIQAGFTPEHGFSEHDLIGVAEILGRYVAYGTIPDGPAT